MPELELSDGTRIMWLADSHSPSAGGVDQEGLTETGVVDRAAEMVQNALERLPARRIGEIVGAIAADFSQGLRSADGLGAASELEVSFGITAGGALGVAVASTEGEASITVTLRMAP